MKGFKYPAFDEMRISATVGCQQKNSIQYCKTMGLLEQDIKAITRWKSQPYFCVRLREVQSTMQIFARSSPDKLESRAVADLRHFKQQTVYVLPSTVDQSTNLDTPRIGEVIVHPLNDSNNLVAPMQLRVANWAQW